jgi:hypothetical protein
MVRSKATAATMIALLTMVEPGCGGDYGEMTIVLEGMGAALGSWSDPSLVNIVVYAPRPASAPMAEVRFSDPLWDHAREERRITTWNGADRMTLSVAWPRGEIRELRVQAVAATGACGSERVLLAEGTQQGFVWRGQGDAAVTVSMRPQFREIRSESDVGGCR